MATRNNYLQGTATRGSYSPAVYTPIAYNAIGMDAPIQEDFNTLANSLKQIEDRKEKTEALTSTISSELGKLNLNPSEDAWKFNYINDIRNQINEAIQFGDYSRALSRARSLASEAYTSPALRGRIRAQKDYKTFVDGTLSRKDLTEDDKAWALANNTYHYEDKVDKSGNIVGGTEWKPTTLPVGEVDWNKILATAKQLVHQKTGNSTSTMFVDANGNKTNNILEAEQVLYQTTNGWSGIDKKTLNNMVEAAIDNTPGARARIDQDWEVLNWRYNTGKIDDTDKELFHDNGKKFTKEEWYNNRFGKAIDSMSGMNYTSNITYNNDYFKYKLAKQNAINRGDNDRGYLSRLTTNATPIEDVDDTFNLATGKAINSIQGIENMFGALKNNPNWIAAKNSGDYNKLVDIISKKNFITTDDRRIKLNSYINDLRDNATIVNNVMRSGINPQAYLFNAAFTTGSELPARNEYTKKYMNRYNDFVGDGKYLKYTFNNNTELHQFAEATGLDLENNDANLISTYNGHPCLIINRGDPRNYKGIYYYHKLGKNITSINSLDENGNNITRVMDIPMNGAPTPSSQFDYSYDAGSSYFNLIAIPSQTEAITKKDVGDKAGIITTYTAKHGMLPAIDAARIQKERGLIDGIEYERQVKDANRAILNNLYGTNGSQLKIAVLGKDDTILKYVDSKERLNYLNAIQARLKNESNAEDFIGTYAYANDIGIHIRLPKDINKSKGAYVSGDVDESEIVIFGIDDPTIERLKGNTNFRGENEYRKLRKFNNINRTFYDGSSIAWNKNTNGTPVFIEKNGNITPINDDTAIKLLSAQKGYEDIKQAVASQNMQNAGNLFKAWTAEYYPQYNSPEVLKQFSDIIFSQIINELK